MVPHEDLLALVLEILEFDSKRQNVIISEIKRSGLANDAASAAYALDGLRSISDALWRSANGTYDRTDKMLNGACLTHRLSLDEIENDLVHTVPDLTGLVMDLDIVSLGDGGHLVHIFGDSDGIVPAERCGSFVGPKDWLKRFSPGTLVAFKRSGNTVTVFEPKEVGRGEKESSALLNSFVGLYNRGVGVEPMEILLDALCGDRLLFRNPVAPISELFEQILLETKDGLIGPSVESWCSLGEKLETDTKDELFAQLQFDSCCIEQFDLAIFAFRSWRSRTDQIDFSQVRRALSHDLVSLGFNIWVHQYESQPIPFVASFMSALIDSGTSHLAAPFFVRSVARTLSGEALKAGEDLRHALRYDPNFELAEREYLTHLADTGDFERFLNFLNSCQTGYAKEQSQHIQEMLALGDGTNHDSTSNHTLQLTPYMRRRWLTQRLENWMCRPERKEYISDYFLTFEEPMLDLNAEIYHNLVVDVAMYEGQEIENYIELKSEILCDKDLEELQSMAKSRRSLFEIIRVDKGKSLVVRDTLTADQFSVSHENESLSMVSGDYFLARLIGDREKPLISGPVVTVKLRDREAMLEILRNEPQPHDFLGSIAQVLKPFKYYESDEPSFTIYQTILKPNLQDRLAQALSCEYQLFREGEWDVINHNEKCRLGTITLSSPDKESLLRIESSDKQKLEMILLELQYLIGSFEVLKMDQQSVRTFREPFTNHIKLQSEGELSNQSVEILNELVETIENQWLHDSIPVLGGSSPYQAWLDPTRREDLARLLREFETLETILLAGREITSLRVESLREKIGYLTHQKK